MNAVSKLGSVFLAGTLLATGTVSAAVIQIDLNYNFNGIVHAGEGLDPDSPTGYRSISDRGLDFSAGVPNHPVLNKYKFVTQGHTLDIVHLGNRDTVDSGNHFFDPDVNGDDWGIKPDWLSNVDQTGPQTTVLNTPIHLHSGSYAEFLFQISNGGGSFDVTFHFSNGSSYTQTLTGPDWYGPGNGQPNIGSFPGVERVDLASPGPPLLLTEGVIDLSNFAGQTLAEITFSNRTNANAGYAIVAANVEGNIPEPASLMLLGSAGLLLLRRQRDVH